MAFIKVLESIKLPTWALCPIFNCDYSAIDSDYEKLVDQFDQSMRDQFGQYTIDIVNQEEDFTPFPEFGLACDCVLADIWSTVE